LVAAWTVNDPEDLARVRDAGADAICGDFPDRTLAALGR
jgi:glycerophosphoryl diester phosphodiesterase